MRLSTLVGFLGASSATNAGAWSNAQAATSKLGPAIGQSLSSGMAGVGKAATIYGPMVADQTTKLSGEVRPSLSLG